MTSIADTAETTTWEVTILMAPPAMVGRGLTAQPGQAIQLIKQTLLRSKNYQYNDDAYSCRIQWRKQ